MVDKTRKIIQLSKDVAEKIAAGEIVERPESVLKELLENSLDAGAHYIHVSLNRGGKDLIRVKDDGEGIPAEELPLAVARYATSKISSSEDLWSLHTFGFRGEALASIGRVSELTVTSSTDGLEGARISISGGEISRVQPAACPKGTIIEVRNLFFSVPARRKFLRRDATEFGRASDWVLRAALGAVGTGFKLEHDNKVIWNITPSASFEERISIFYGPEVSQKLLPVDLTGPISVNGVVGRPEVSRRDRRYTSFFVNGRFIRDKTLGQALREAFRGYLIPGKFPFAVLFLNIDPARIDINVHPAKAEIRYQNGQEVFQAVFRAVRQALSALGPRVIPVPGDHHDSKISKNDVLDFFSKPGALEKSYQNPFHSKTKSYHNPQGDMVQAGSFERLESLDQPMKSFGQSESLDQPMKSFGQSESLDHSPESFVRPKSFDQAMSVKESLQVKRCYLVFESEDGLEIVDQHALHEKILYHEILNRLKRGGIPEQVLLVPVTARFTPGEMSQVERYASILGKLGLTIEIMGPEIVKIKTVPALGKTDNPEKVLRELLASVAENSTGEQLKPLAQRLACSMAIKSGKIMSPGEQAALLARANCQEDLDTCPHGRPTHLKLSFLQLKKHFDRTG